MQFRRTILSQPFALALFTLTPRPCSLLRAHSTRHLPSMGAPPADRHRLGIYPHHAWPRRFHPHCWPRPYVQRLFSGSAEDNVRQVTDNPPIVQNGNNVEVGLHTHYSNVSIDYVVTAPSGTSISANSGSGDLNITGLSAPLTASTGSGDILAKNLTGDISLSTGSGEIHAQMNSSHSTRAQTGSGSIQLEGVTGGLQAKTGSGDITISGQPGDNWKLETGSGSVTLNTGHSAFNLDFSTGSGDVHSDPPLTTHGTLNAHHVTGEINGGGPTVRVDTGSGDIRIH